MNLDDRLRAARENYNDLAPPNDQDGPRATGTGQLPRAGRRSQRMWAAAAALVLVGSLAVAVVAVGNRGDGSLDVSSTPEAVTTSSTAATTQPSVPEIVVEDDHVAIPGGTPTPAVLRVGELTGTELQDWYEWDGDPARWGATYLVAGTTSPTQRVAIVTGPSIDREQIGQRDIKNVYLPGNLTQETVVAGADSAFIRRNIDVTDLAVESDGRFFLLTVGSDVELPAPITDLASTLVREGL